MNFKFTKRAVFVLLFMIVATVAKAVNIKGIVVDKTTQEPLIGATVIIANSTTGVVAGIDGDFELDLPKGPVSLVVSFVTYKTQQLDLEITRGMEPLLIQMEAEAIAADEVQVVGRKNLENVAALQQERKAATAAIENLGSKEMSIKGISNVEEGVTKMTGVSVAGAGQIIVRGLSDRYSLTTLNGQPIASPNPDNKLIPLNIFPSSAVKNITVSKVYNPDSYADYSGAHINISTKDQRSDDFFTFDLSVGANLNTVGADFYRMDHNSLFGQSKVGFGAADVKKSEFSSIFKKNNIFDTDFSVSSKTSLPTLSGNLGFGRNFDIGNQELSVLVTGGLGNEQTRMLDNVYNVVEASGVIADAYNYDSYTTELKMAALADIGMTLRERDRINYTMFFARNASEDYQLRDGQTDNQGHVVSSNSVTHIYKLLTNQLHGIHALTEKSNLNWDVTYTTTASDEPDRRQVMFTDNALEDGYMLYTNDAQSTMRYFGALAENELNADINTDIKFGEANKLVIGAAYKNKNREYEGVRYYYDDIFGVRNEVDGYNVYDTDKYLNYGNIQNGTIGVSRSKLPNDTYDADNVIYSGYVNMDLAFSERFLLNLGLRYEHSSQVVNYYDTQYQTRVLKSPEFFPALNMKYNFTEDKLLRFSFSRTVTRPSFIEMAPFLYQESYGSAQIIGNGDLQNGYNYNADLRYEMFMNGSDMFSVTAYFKQLTDPIERVQKKQGGSTLHTFMNAEDGIATGLEVEFRKKLSDAFNFNINASYMYTNIHLSDGAYTHNERQLQGASPYLLNADLIYTPTIRDEKPLNLALIYSLQGPRIHAVGLNGQGDVYQKTMNKLNLVSSYQLSKTVALKLDFSNILNIKETYEQEVIETGDMVLVERHTLGTVGSVGVSLKF